MNEQKKILIVRTDRIGDVVLTLPMAKFTKETYPNYHITFLVRNYTKEFPTSNKYVDDTIILPEKSFFPTLKKLTTLLKVGKFDAAIVVHPRLVLALAIFFAGIKTRIGSGYRFFSFLFTNKIYEHRKTGDKHELEYNLNLLAPLGIKISDTKSVSFDIQIKPETEQRIKQLLNDFSIPGNKPIIIIHPGSGGSSIDWPISRFSELSTKLAYKLDCSIVITGSQSEKETCEKIMTEKNTYNLAGKLSLEELNAVINRSVLLIANSTGPIHIAAALDKHVIGFYPKIKECSVDRWGPYTDKKMIFSPTIDCSNCSREQCERLDCMNSIDVESVFSGIKKIIEPGLK